MKKKSSGKECTMSRTFVLIHGTWHGGWAWDEVIGHLSSHGHRAYAPTLAGHGPGATRTGITHEDCVKSVVTFVREHRLDDIILVGHSFGGTIVQRAAEEIGNRITRTVFLDALVLNRNESVFEILPTAFLDSLQASHNGGQNATSAADLSEFAVPPWETWRDNFMQDAVEEHAWLTWEQLAPEPAQVNLDKLDLSRFYSLNTIPRSYVYCRHDRAMPPGYFHPGMSSRLGEFKLVEMDGSHEVMFSRPAELADKLIDAATD
jgi:pimeloyl-ACP methyl ester carboxylesterase